MKTLTLLIIALASLASISIKGQSIDTASIWRINSSIWEPGVEIRYNYFKDYIDGDTTINSKQYLKVYKSGYQYIDWIPNPYYNYFQHELHGFLREENNKWYTYDGNQDKLLFDFTMTVNDTVFSAFTIPLSDPIIITAIDSILIDSVYKKRFHLNIAFGAQYIIEDIGATTGLFENMEFFEWDSKLVCFAKNGISLWADSTLECNLNVNVSETKTNIGSVTLYPNPADDYTILSIPLDFNMPNILLLDSFGKTVFNKSNVRDKTIKIQLSTFPKGLYLFLVNNGDKKQLMKLVIK